MPKVNSIPEFLKPFVAHGVDIDSEQDKKEALGVCPFCSKHKFYVNRDTGLWSCKVCGLGGNVNVFLQQVWEYSAARTTVADYQTLAAQRKLLDHNTLSAWGVVKSFLTDEWLIPAYGPDEKLKQLYRYVKSYKTGKYTLYATPTVKHYIFGMPKFNKAKRTLYLCEGPWDGMALWEMLQHTSTDKDSKLVFTNQRKQSLGQEVNVLAIPGCNSFTDLWTPIFGGKKVILLYDNDHPQENKDTGKLITPAAYAGLKRTVESLSLAFIPPEEIKILSWGSDGFDDTLPSGFDVRDALVAAGDDWHQRIAGLEFIFDRISIVSDEWREEIAQARLAQEIKPAPCHNWEVLINAWKKALKWTDGLDRSLAFMLSCVVSTMAIGDQLWGKVIGPASCGKSTLCEALSVARKYVIAKSTIRGFHSGYQTDKDGTEDNSLTAKVGGKTLVTKDGDTLLQSPNLGQILSEARDLYDCTARVSYKNKVDRNYQGIRMTWILCGTSSLKSIDSSELGERFLDCVMMERIDEDLEDEILQRVVYRVERNMAFEANGQIDTHHDPDMMLAMQLTGGYVEFLRENAQTLLSNVKTPEWVYRQIRILGKFVAFMRARPSTKQDESAEREFASRLVSQLMRLAKCLGAVMSRQEIDHEVMRRVTQVALDTARGKMLEITKHLHKAGRTGIETKTIAMMIGDTEDKIRTLLRFGFRIRAIEHFDKNPDTGSVQRVRWRLTSGVTALYEEVMSYVKEHSSPKDDTTRNGQLH